MAELVDALDSGSSGHSLWGFKSPLPHQIKTRFRVFSFWGESVLWRVDRYGFRQAGRACIWSPSDCVFPCGSRTCTVCTDGSFLSVATMLS